MLGVPLAVLHKALLHGEWKCHPCYWPQACCESRQVYPYAMPAAICHLRAQVTSHCGAIYTSMGLKSVEQISAWPFPNYGASENRDLC